MRQLPVLVERYARLLWRDPRNLLILGLQVPILAVLIASLFGGDVFDLEGGNAQQAAQLLFLVLTTAIWFGAIDAAREIIKERSILDRERGIGAAAERLPGLEMHRAALALNRSDGRDGRDRVHAAPAGRRRLRGTRADRDPDCVELGGRRRSAW